MLIIGDGDLKAEIGIASKYGTTQDIEIMRNWNFKDRNKEATPPSGLNAYSLSQWSVVETQQSSLLSERSKSKGTVIVVDDQDTGRRILAEMLLQLDPEIKVQCFSNPEEAINQARREIPDLILTDYKMPSMDGVEFTRQIRKIKSCSDVPIVVITVCDDKVVRYKALDAGATDFITRPIDQYECKARFRNLLVMRKQQRIIKNRASWMEEQVAVATEHVRLCEQEALLTLAKAGEYHHSDAGTHVVRVAKLSRLIAEGLGLPKALCEEIEIAAPLHDVGNIGIPSSILLKEGKLTDSEYTVLKSHTVIGHSILKGNQSKFTQLAAIIALNHHERFDGTGYPYGLSGEEILLPARIVGMADVYEALINERTYRAAWNSDNVMQYFISQSGRHFDPQCVEVLIKRDEEIKFIQSRFEMNCAME